LELFGNGARESLRLQHRNTYSDPHHPNDGNDSRNSECIWFCNLLAICLVSNRVVNGDDEALARIAPLVHAELYRLAKRYMSKERPDHLLQTSALINEAYVRLIDWKAVRWQNRAHFFGVAAQMMRRILV